MNLVERLLSCLLGLAILSGTAGCFLFNGGDIPYTAEPLEFSQSLGNSTGNFPQVDCSASDSVCSAMTGLPGGAAATCEAQSGGARECVLHFDLTVAQTVNLSKQASLPSAVTSSSLVNNVTIDEVRYWVGSAQSLDVATPPLDIYIGDQNATGPTSSGVEKLGTIGSIPAMMAPSAAPDCMHGPATSDTTYCDLQLTAAGTSLLATLAKDYQTPFKVILVGHLTITGGQPIPAGTLDLVLQPVIGFHL
jgi:hypothetical protein